MQVCICIWIVFVVEKAVGWCKTATHCTSFATRLQHNPSSPCNKHRLFSTTETTTTQVDTSSLRQSAERHVVDQFVTSFQSAVQSRDPSSVQSLLQKDAIWSNPKIGMVEQANFAKSFLELHDLGDNPSMQVFETKELSSKGEFSLSLQWSSTMKLPWKPRVIVPCNMKLYVNPQTMLISRIEEKWDLTVLEIAVKQVSPRLWDLWHVYSSPQPEYPPISTLGKAGQVKLLELPETILFEIDWRGLAKYPGPPLAAIPSFTFIGELLKAKSRSSSSYNYYTSLPVEADTTKFLDKVTGKEFKQSTWRFHVPTQLQHLVSEQAKSAEWQSLAVESLLDDVNIDELLNRKTTEIEEAPSSDKFDSDLMEADPALNQLAQSLMTVKQTREFEMLNATSLLDSDIKEFEQYQQVRYRYRITPKRVIAAIDYNGRPDGKFLGEKYEALTAQLQSGEVQYQGRPVRVKRAQDPNESDKLFGIQLWSTKMGFNDQALPAIGVYEMQYNQALNRVFVEVEL